MNLVRTMWPFDYPSAPHVRRHGPRGYQDYRAYKRWLRDEFAFQCVYCLTREKWRDDQDDSFTVDHVVAKSAAPELECEYTNLVYSCARCNSLKGTGTLLDPCEEGFDKHLAVDREGEIEGKTDQGRRFVSTLRLDSPKRTEFRRRMLRLLDWLRFPENLPDVGAMKPREGNARPDGISQSWNRRREDGTLPWIY